MPFQQLNADTNRIRIGPYGHKTTDEDAEHIDPYWLHMSDDGQYFAVSDDAIDIYRIFEARNGGWEEVKQLPCTNTTKRECVIEFHPNNEKLLFNDNGTAKEYNLETDTISTLFSLPSDQWAATYWPEDRTKYQVGDINNNSVSVRNADGSISESRSASLGSGKVSWATVVYNEQFNQIWTTGNGTLRVFDLSGAEQGFLTGPGYRTVYSRGPYITTCSISGYGLIMENTGVFRQVFPKRSNVVTMRDPDNRDGMEFLSTFNFSAYRHPESQVHQQPPMSSWSDRRIEELSDTNTTMTKEGVCHPRSTTYVSCHAADSNHTHRIIQKPKYEFIDKFPTPLVDTSRAGDDRVIREETGKTAEFEINGYVPFQVETEFNGSGTVGDATIEFNYGHD